MFKRNESRLTFCFDTSWRIVYQWEELPSFKEGIAKLASAKPVDFIGLHGSDPYFIEVKNFCGYRIENKRKFTSGTLATDIADKVRDTLAGLVWAMERGHDSAELAPLLRQVFSAKSKCKVVFWLEEDPQSHPADRSALAEAIKARLSWLKPHVIVRSRRDPPLPGVDVVGVSSESDARS